MSVQRLAANSRWLVLMPVGPQAASWSPLRQRNRSPSLCQHLQLHPLHLQQQLRPPSALYVLPPSQALQLQSLWGVTVQSQLPVDGITSWAVLMCSHERLRNAPCAAVGLTSPHLKANDLHVQAPESDDVPLDWEKDGAEGGPVASLKAKGKAAKSAPAGGRSRCAPVHLHQALRGLRQSVYPADLACRAHCCPH